MRTLNKTVFVVEVVVVCSPPFFILKMRTLWSIVRNRLFKKTHLTAARARVCIRTGQASRSG